MSSGVRVGGLAASLCAAVAIQVAPASAHVHRVPTAHRPTVNAPKRKYGRGTSTNWSGYAVDGSGAASVTGTWTVNKVTCAASETSWSSPWVGIDGDVSRTVEQTGTDSDCQGGTPTYYAWYEMYPKSLVQIPMAIAPGNSITGTVTYGASGFTLTLSDNTTHATYTTTQASKKAARSSVEWIVEGPSSGTLSNFGTEPFSAASAKINGESGSLDTLSGANPITMVSAQGVTRATPSALGQAGAFSVAWQHG
jgi:Peptidase A4 family